MLKIDQVCSAYGEAQVLNDISMYVNEGEIVALLGRNGMGKTSLVRTVMNLSNPQKTKGQISIGGQSLEGLAPYQVSRAGLGYVPQGRRLFSSLTVLEHLQILDKKSPGAWSIEKVFENFSRLAERKTNRGNELSGGERQLLAIARALMTGPKILLMDEPTEGLAPVTVELVEGVMQTLKKEGLGILLVEQNLYSALAVADRVYILETGMVVWQGTPSELMAHPETLERYLGIH